MMKFERPTRSLGLAALALVLSASGCDSGQLGEADQQIVTASVTPDHSAYTPGQDIAIAFTSDSGAATDWVALALTSDAPNVYRDWQYTGGGGSGTVTFIAPSLSNGTYEARLFYDWAGTSSYTVEASGAFSVGAGVSTTKSAYNGTEPVVVDYVGLPGNQKDWVAIAPQGSPNTVFSAWTYTNGQISGEASFTGISPGTFVARTFIDDGYTLQSESAPFTVAAGASGVTTDKVGYLPADSITVSWTGLDTNPTDWVALASAGAPNDTYIQWAYTGGTASGSYTFSPLPAGSYEARTFYHDGYTLGASAAFTVGGNPGVATDNTTYTQGSVVTINYAGMPGNPKDWVAVSAAGSPASSYIQWAYINGAASGSQAFSSLPAGNYEARAYSNDTFTVLATSTFTITAVGAASTSTDASSYTTSQTVTVSYTGLPGNSDDWVGISVAGSADTAYVDFVYTSGQAAGTATFSGLAAGSYEARTYAHNTFTVVARSSTFTVN